MRILLALLLVACVPQQEEGSAVSGLTGGTSIVSAIGGRCLDDNNNGTENGNKIQLWSCNGASAQKWIVSNGTIIDLDARCLDIQTNRQVNGTIVQLYQCNGTTAQKWTVSSTSIKSTDGLCLGVRGDANANGTQIELETCNGGVGQQWAVGGASSGACPNGMDGFGTSGSPCLITSCTDLQAISQSASLDYRLANDIDCSATRSWNSGAGFLPIDEFYGDFDGHALTIDGLYESADSTSVYVGLFGQPSGAIHDLKLTNAIINGATFVGAIAGDARGAITNCSAAAQVTGGTYVGGLVGNGGTISGSSSTGTVSGGTYVGGLVGNALSLSNCSSSANVTGTDSEIGGLVGCFAGSVSNSHATGSVTGTQWYTSYVGGLCGSSNGDGVTKSFATGAVRGGDFVGGLCGDVSTIDQSYETGNVTATSAATRVGGLASGAAVTNSYARGNVSAVGTSYVGGLVGVGSASNSYATGSVTGGNEPGDFTGGLLGIGTQTSSSFAAGAILSAGAGLAGQLSGSPTGTWYDRSGTMATECYGTTLAPSNVGCTKIPATTSISYFYDTANAPLKSWSYGAGNSWSSVCSGESFPVLTFENITSKAGCH